MTEQAMRVQTRLLNHERNLGIEFKPGPHTYHRYYDDGESEQYYGVTSLLDKYAPFDAESVKYAIARRDGKTVEEVQAEWDAARDHGSEVHDILEQWGVTGEYSGEEHVQDLIKFCEDNRLTPIAFEHVIYCDKLKRSTPADILLVDQWGRLVVGDHKTSKEIKYSHYKYKGKKTKMEYPLIHLPTSNYYKYSLQIALARTWLERYYFPNGEIEISPTGYIFHIRDGKFTPHKTLPMYTEVDKIYEWEEKTAA